MKYGGGIAGQMCAVYLQTMSHESGLCRNIAYSCTALNGMFICRLAHILSGGAEWGYFCE